MKILYLLFIVSLLMTTCELYESPYEVEEKTTHVVEGDWHNQYIDIDTTLDWNISDSTIIKTKWVLDTYSIGSNLIQSPKDTIYFVDLNKYAINKNTNTYSLSMSFSTTKYELTLNNFKPFGGSDYSTQISYYFINDWEINNALFINLQNENSDEIQACFNRIE